MLTVVIGLLAGLHIATWGMYKDAIHEGFSWRTYLRSVVVALLVAVGVHAVVDLHPGRPSSWVVLFGLIYTLERALVEFYKVFVREEDQSKYFIPAQFHINGRIVHDRRLRALIAAAYVGVVLLAFGGVHLLQQTGGAGSRLAVLLLVGSIGGWISAFGGAFKDAPIEGFDALKFFRSPLLALIYAVLLAGLTDSYLLIALSALGYTIATIETYKTFCFPARPRGKFAGKPVLFPGMLRYRRRFVPIYVLIWLLVVGAFVAAYVHPHRGLLPLG